MFSVVVVLIFVLCWSPFYAHVSLNGCAAKEEKKTKLKIKCKTDKSGNRIKKPTNKGKIKNEVNTIKVSTKITNEYGDTAGR